MLVEWGVCCRGEAVGIWIRRGEGGVVLVVAREAVGDSSGRDDSEKWLRGVGVCVDGDQGLSVKRGG